MTTSTITWIKSQGLNRKLVGSWDNFEFRENVHGERIGDKVKFLSVTMALWNKKGWHIPDGSLQQWMWDSKRESPTAYSITSMVFGRVGEEDEKSVSIYIDSTLFELRSPKKASATIRQCPLSISLIVNVKDLLSSFLFPHPYLMKVPLLVTLLFSKISTYCRWN